MLKPRVYGLDPIVGENPEILILGTFPAEDSRKAKEYYAHPKNNFWPIINRLFNNGVGFNYYLAGVQCLKNNHIAVWDIYYSKEDNGNSRNGDIRNTEENDIAGFLAKYPTIKRIVFNGDSFKYHLVCAKQNIPLEMCVFAQQTSGRCHKTVLESLPSWRSALTEI